MMKAGVRMASDEEIYAYMRRILTATETSKRLLGNVFQSLLAKQQLELTMPQFYMLYLINEQEPCKLTRLAEQMEVKPSAITVMLDRLVQSGQVMRSSDDKDRRVVLVQLTDKGREAFEQARRIRREMMQRLLAHFDLPELEAFTNSLEKIARLAAEENR
ncbi:MarR family transcriptional regulator [Paenibacillus sp. MBLB4367]|uniref:MarR family transcriptional regulator n=1 Tax=Paenibacillus sp. MBLB4367 TaxID=3384767 RepID=UPI0039082921